MTFTLHGLGTAVPPTRLLQEESARVALALGSPSEEQATWLPGIYANSGISSRNVFYSGEVIQDVLQGTQHSGSIFLPRGTPDDRGPTTAQRMQHYSREAAPLAVQAARVALRESTVHPEQITHLVTVSCTGFQAPGVDILLIHHLELPPTVERTHVGYMGCHGALNGLRVAHALSLANKDSCVLLCAVELCSLHYYYGWEPQKVIANALFADGAAAVVGTATSPSLPSHWKLVGSGSCIIPDSQGAMTWTIEDHGFAMTLSKRVPQLIETHLGPWLSSWLQKFQLTPEEIGSWAVHPGGPKILDAVEQALMLSPQDLQPSRAVLDEHGNMSSPTLLFILERLRKSKADRPCVAMGFGPGLTVEAALFW